MSSKSWIRILSIAISTLCLVLSIGVSNISLATTAGNIYVAPSGSDRLGSGNSSDSPMQTIQSAINKAQPGDTINLAPGTYLQDFVTKIDGIQNKPITITGSADAVIKGGGKPRVVEVNHDNTVLNGFTIDGLWGSANSAKGYRDKLIYVQGKGNKSGVENLKIVNMHIQNAGGECIRLRYFAKNNEIAFNTIQNCGVKDFKFGGTKKNGEAVYVGTAPEQNGDGKNPTSDLDRSSNNWIHNNKIDTQGNECVDIKEGATDNIVENNICTGQKDPNSGGFSVRGNNNTIRLNKVYNNNGAGIRLGGDTPRDGSENQVYGNNIYNNAGGGIKFQAEPQTNICGNTMVNNTVGDSIGKFSSRFSPTDNCVFSNYQNL